MAGGALVRFDALYLYFALRTLRTDFFDFLDLDAFWRGGRLGAIYGSSGGGAGAAIGGGGAIIGAGGGGAG